MQKAKSIRTSCHLAPHVMSLTRILTPYIVVTTVALIPRLIFLDMTVVTHEIRFLKLRNFLRYYNTPEEHKVDVASVYLEGIALDVYSTVNDEVPIIDWDELTQLFQEQF
ncbi:hypothetical protein LINPERHAP1_LOCUS18579, partial [Linum perenne]